MKQVDRPGRRDEVNEVDEALLQKYYNYKVHNVNALQCTTNTCDLWTGQVRSALRFYAPPGGHKRKLHPPPPPPHAV